MLTFLVIGANTRLYFRAVRRLSDNVEYMGDQEMVDRIIMLISAAGIVSAGWLMQDGPDILARA